MPAIELHIVTLCALLLAIEPARKLGRSVKNWLDRQRIHREHVKSLEQILG